MILRTTVMKSKIRNVIQLGINVRPNSRITMTMVIGSKVYFGAHWAPFFIPSPEASPSTFNILWACDTMTVLEVAQRGFQGALVGCILMESSGTPQWNSPPPPSCSIWVGTSLLLATWMNSSALPLATTTSAIIMVMAGVLAGWMPTAASPSDSCLSGTQGVVKPAPTLYS